MGCSLGLRGGMDAVFIVGQDVTSWRGRLLSSDDLVQAAEGWAELGQKLLGWKSGMKMGSGG